MSKYTEATNEIVDIAQELIRSYHPHLRECNIGFVLRDEAGTSGGKEVLAKVSKVQEKIKPHLQEELDVLIVIAEDIWSKLNSTQRQAAIDHELCHIKLDGDGYKIVAHDFEEFKDVLDRWGFWTRDLLAASGHMGQAFEQLVFGIDGLQKGKVVAVEPEGDA